MNWEKLTLPEQLNEIDQHSQSSDVLIFKHSTRCATSAMALDRIQRRWDPKFVNKLKPYYLDLISYREVSGEVGKRYKVAHESPQILVIRNGKCIFSASHFGINFEDVVEVVGSVSA